MNLKTISDFLPTPVVYCDTDLVYRYANPAALRWHGMVQADIVGLHISSVMGTDQAARLRKYHDAVLNGEPLTTIVNRRFRDGTTRKVRTDFVPDLSDAGEIDGFYVLLTDLTELLDAQNLAQCRLEEMQFMADAVPAMIYRCDHEDRCIFANQTMGTWLGRASDAIIGRKLAEIFDQGVFDWVRSVIAQATENESIVFEDCIGSPDGRRRQLEVTVVPRLRPDRSVDSYTVLAIDISERKCLEENLRRLANLDPLTELANRRRLYEVGAEEFERARRYVRPLSVVMADFDRFKSINDRFGHAAGDSVLKGFAAVMRESLREIVDRAARMGGEEFALLLPETDLQGAIALAERLRENIEQQDFSAVADTVTCSFGVAEMENGDSDIAAVLNRADQALYRAKSAGRNTVWPSLPDKMVPGLVLPAQKRG